MSRSYKKTAGWTDHKTPRTKEEKIFANGAVRKAKDIPNGGAYKKIYNSWDICDYKFLYFSKNEVLKAIEKYKNYELYKYYMK